MKKYYNWILINVLLPLLPFGIRIFVSFLGKEESLSFAKIAELPEIIFFSLYLCVVNLNININGKRGYFESALRIFLFVIIVLDGVVLGMIYSDNIGSNAFPFSLVVAIVPTAIAPIYKFKYKRKLDD